MTSIVQDRTISAPYLWKIPSISSLVEQRQIVDPDDGLATQFSLIRLVIYLIYLTTLSF